MKLQFLFLMFYCHAHITNQLYSKVVTSSVAEKWAKRVRNGPRNYPKIKIRKYEKLWYSWLEHQKHDQKHLETYA